MGRKTLGRDMPRGIEHTRSTRLQGPHVVACVGHWTSYFQNRCCNAISHPEKTASLSGTRKKSKSSPKAEGSSGSTSERAEVARSVVNLGKMRIVKGLSSSVFVTLTACHIISVTRIRQQQYTACDVDRSGIYCVSQVVYYRLLQLDCLCTRIVGPEALQFSSKRPKLVPAYA